MKKRMFDKKIEREIFDLYVYGFQGVELAKIYGCGVATISRVVHRQNCPFKGHFGVHNKNNGGIYYDRGYKRLMIPGRKGIREHRLIMENKIGRKLHRWEFVHHINGIRNDNRIENLQIMTPSEHTKLHHSRGNKQLNIGGLTMGIIGISLSETKDFISSADTSEPKTIFKLGVLDAEVFASLGELANNPLKMMLEIVKYGLRGFSNFNDAGGNPVQFRTVAKQVGPTTYQVVADSIIKIIPSQIINEMGAEILQMSKLTEQETKNS
jgi:hypothetical protein